MSEFLEFALCRHRDAGCVQAPPCESSPEKAAPVLTIRNNHPYL
jgi:hypothetical protein